MQDYDEIRRRFLAGESQRHIAKAMGISRNTVKKYCEGNAVPWERKTPDRESTILTPDVVRFIQNCCFLASNFPHFHRYDSLKSALYIHAVLKNINTFPKNQGRIRAAIAVEILDFTVMYR